MAREYVRLGSARLAMVERLAGEYDGFSMTPENARTFLADPDCWFFACVEDGRILGFCLGYVLKRMDDRGGLLYIHEVDVLPGYRRQGIGRTMLNMLKILCRLSDIRRMFLITQRSNIPAVSLYESVRGREAHRDDMLFVFDDLDVP